MVGSIFSTLSDIITAFGTLMTGIFQRIVLLMYTPPVQPATTGTLTTFGALCLVGLASGLFMFGLHFVRSLIRVKTK